jgi:hypothetical protein
VNATGETQQLTLQSTTSNNFLSKVELELDTGPSKRGLASMWQTSILQACSLLVSQRILVP